MRYFIDTEFHENGRTIDLISVGIVADDGREFYAVSSEFDVDAVLAHPWLMENVWPSLPTTEVGKATGGTRPALDMNSPLVMPRRVIADRVHDFLLADRLGTSRAVRQLWGYYAAYDHVALCQLFGRMIDLPDGVPMFTCDLKPEIVRLGNPDLPRQDGPQHEALADARWNRDVRHLLDAIAAEEADRA